jgi:hypothetical protein
MKRNTIVRVIATGEILVVDRIDNHVYPVCAGYRRFKRDDLMPL